MKGIEFIRTLISRYYYGVFHYAKERLISKGYKERIFEVPNIHNFIRRLIEKEYKNPKVDSYFRQLFALRIQADYKLSKRIDYKHLKQAKLLSKILVGLL